jgi:cyclophilin family peptidyl-prolyl cis-trans isomerase
LAWARTGDQVNPTRASSGSQFYITQQETPFLDGQYSVFGQVIGHGDVDKTPSETRFNELTSRRAAIALPPSTWLKPQSADGRPPAVRGRAKAIPTPQANLDTASRTEYHQDDEAGSCLPERRKGQ